MKQTKKSESQKPVYHENTKRNESAKEGQGEEEVFLTHHPSRITHYGL
jgi:hypothetical protein